MSEYVCPYCGEDPMPELHKSFGVVHGDWIYRCPFCNNDFVLWTKTHKLEKLPLPD